MSILRKALTTAALATALIANGAFAETKRVVIVVKALGIGFFGGGPHVDVLGKCFRSRGWGLGLTGWKGFGGGGAR